MNPSYNSGGIGNTGVSGAGNVGGGIYSSGVTPPVNSGRPGTSGTPISSPPVMKIGGSSRGPRKGIIIGAILIVVALVLGILAVVLMPKGGSSNNVATENTDFYKYANYLLYGNSNANTNLGEYDENANYTVITEFSDGNVGYFDTLQNLWNGFYERIIKDENIAETSTLRGEVGWQNELMDFVGKYVKVEEWDEEKLLDLYLKNGREKATTMVDDNYKNLATTTYEDGKDYAKALIDWSKAAVDLYASLDSYNCLADGDIDGDCVERNSENLGAAQDYENNTNYILYLDEINSDDLLEMLANGCFSIAANLSGDNKNE